MEASVGCGMERRRSSQWKEVMREGFLGIEREAVGFLTGARHGQPAMMGTVRLGVSSANRREVEPLYCLTPAVWEGQWPEAFQKVLPPPMEGLGGQVLGWTELASICTSRKTQKRRVCAGTLGGRRGVCHGGGGL